MLEIPELSDVKRFVDNGFSKAFYGVSGTIRVAVLKVFSSVVAGAVYLPILICKKIFKNAFVSTCDVNFLDVHGTDYSLPHKPACYAHGTVTINGSAGTTISSGTKLQDDISGHEYELVGNASVGSEGFVFARVKATEIGPDYNLSYGAVMTFQDGTPSGVTSCLSGTITGGTKVSVDLGDRTEYWGETAEEYRARLLQRKQNQPKGGASPDWWGWVMRFNTVTNCWVKPNWPWSNGVTLWVNNTNNPNGYVPADDIAEIQAYVSDSEKRRPVTSRPVVVACSPAVLSMTICLVEITEVVKQNILSALKDYLKTFAPGSTISISILNDIVRAVSGEQTALIMNVKLNDVAKSLSFTLYRSFNEETGAILGSVIDINNIQIDWVRL